MQFALPEPIWRRKIASARRADLPAAGLVLEATGHKLQQSYGPIPPGSASLVSRAKIN